jgi:hypothetical protein
MQQESPKERVDRELGELLEEIRVILPGVELLFAFLLILPFTERFHEISGREEIAYLVCFLATSASTALLIAPSTFHRLRFREGDKEAMLRWANRQVIAASCLITISTSLAVYLVVHVVHGGTLAAIIAAANAAFFTFFWFAVPLLRRASGTTDELP